MHFIQRIMKQAISLLPLHSALQLANNSLIVKDYVTVWRQ